MSRQPDRLDDDSPGAATPPDLDRLIVKSIGWLGVSLGGSQLITFASMVVLARLLDPTAFGLVAVAWSVLALLQEMQDSGLAAALVYRRTDIQRAAGSALAFAPVVSLVLFGIGFAVAPLLARFVGDSAATDVIRALLALLLIRSFGIAPWAIFERGLDYKARARVDLTTAGTQAGVAIGLAAAGAGVWSLVVGQLAGSAAGVAVAWLLVPWRPSVRDADLRVLRELLRYGRWVSSVRAVNIVNRSLDNVVIARLLGTTSLGVYAFAFRMADLPVSLVGAILGRVMFPVYSMLQSDLASIRRIYLENLQRVALVLLPIVVVLMVDAEPIVLALFGDKWRAAITPLQILAAWALVRAFVSPSGPVFDGMGKPHLALYFQIAGMGILLTLLLVLVPRFDLNGAAAAQAIAVTAVGVPMLLLAMHMIELEILELARALGPSVLCSAILAGSLLLTSAFVDSLSPVVALVVIAAIGSTVYIASSMVFARSVVMPIWVNLRRVDDQPT
jgi:O-antigen/teichoic acid export membrane protein